MAATNAAMTLWLSHRSRTNSNRYESRRDAPTDAIAIWRMQPLIWPVSHSLIAPVNHLLRGVGTGVRLREGLSS